MPPRRNRTRPGAEIIPGVLLAAALAAGGGDPWAALRERDARLATIAYRLATANAALCRDVQPTPGMQLHAIDQYGGAIATDARRVFGFRRPVQVEVVVPGGPADRAGVAPDDALIAVGGRPVSPPSNDAATSATRDAAAALIAGSPAAAPLTLTLERTGVRRTVTLAASPGCASAFEVALDRGFAASSDGLSVQVGAGVLDRLDDPTTAAVVAHELAHTVLRHRARLKAAGVRTGLAGEFGRNARLTRQTEDEADRLSVHLLHNAGYDPRAAVAFWRGLGARLDGGPFHSRTHASARARAERIAAEIATLSAPGQRATAGDLLTSADTPLR